MDQAYKLTFIRHGLIEPDYVHVNQTDRDAASNAFRRAEKVALRLINSRTEMWVDFRQVDVLVCEEVEEC